MGKRSGWLTKPSRTEKLSHSRKPLKKNWGSVLLMLLHQQYADYAGTAELQLIWWGLDSKSGQVVP
jgi:hypothetical protein